MIEIELERLLKDAKADPDPSRTSARSAGARAMTLTQASCSP